MGLGKNFLNSVVTQVGRDTGRAISNQVYGDAHSIPIRRVNGKIYSQAENTEIHYNEAVTILEKDGYYSNFKLMDIALVSVIFFFTIPVAMVSVPFFLVRGYINISKKDTPYTKMVTVPTYVRDGRTSTGRRHTGYTQQKVSVKMPASEEEARKYKKRGYIYLAFAAAQVILFNLLLRGGL